MVNAGDVGWLGEGQKGYIGVGKGFDCVEGEGYVEMDQPVGWGKFLCKAVALGKDGKASDEG